MSGMFMPEEGAAGEREWFPRLANAREDPSALAEAREWLTGLLANAGVLVVAGMRFICVDPPAAAGQRGAASEEGRLVASWTRRAFKSLRRTCRRGDPRPAAGAFY